MTCNQGYPLLPSLTSRRRDVVLPALTALIVAIRGEWGEFQTMAAVACVATSVEPIGTMTLVLVHSFIPHGFLSVPLPRCDSVTRQ